MPTRVVAPRLVAVLLLGTALTVVVGCGGGKGNVSGKVSYNGKALPQYVTGPLPYGNIQFISPAGAFVGEIGADGSYSVTGIPVGTSKVSINCQDPKYADYMKALSAASKDKKSMPVGSPDQFNKIPGKYFDPETSQLTFEVKAGSQTWDIDLK